MSQLPTSSQLTTDLSPAVHTAFHDFLDSPNTLALPLKLSSTSSSSDSNTLHALPPIPRPQTTDFISQQCLNALDNVLSPRTVMYLFLRRSPSFVVCITFIPYLAPENQRTWLLEKRYELVEQLGGKEVFGAEIVCKEVAEVTDKRAWDEREKNALEGEAVGDSEEKGGDEGYKKMKCRLCDRRMKNPIEKDALEALGTLKEEGRVVQMTVHPSPNAPILSLLLSTTSLSPSTIPSLLPRSHPTFTFYHHPTSHLIYFIFHSPDTASVQARMLHTMAIPGLVNVLAADAGVHVDQKVEIHDPQEWVFEQGD